MDNQSMNICICSLADMYPIQRFNMGRLSFNLTNGDIAQDAMYSQGQAAATRPDGDSVYMATEGQPQLESSSLDSR